MSVPTWAAPTAPGPVRASVSLPGSKSLTNRYLVLAALAGAPSRLRAPLRSRDTVLMAAALAGLGTWVDDVDPDPGAATSFGADWLITPAALRGPARIDCGLAGTVMRFLPPVAALATGEIELDGDPRARERPMAAVLGALSDLGVDLDAAPGGGCRCASGASVRCVAAPCRSTPRHPASSSPPSCSPRPDSSMG